MTLQQFFDTIVQPDATQGRWVNFRAIHPSFKKQPQIFGGVETGQKFIEQYNGAANIYFGVLPRVRGILPDTARVLWADIDYKMSSEAEATKRVFDFPVTPHIVVSTGGGLHLYWLIEPVPTNRLKAINKALAAAIGGDPASTDTARILRVPGTKNVKYDPHRDCKIERVLDDLTPYKLDDFKLTINDSEVEVEKAEDKKFEASEAGLVKARAQVAVWPPSVSGQGGDNNLYELCAYLRRDAGLSVDQAYEMILPWNQTCRPPWGLGELKSKLSNGRQYGKAEIGSGDPVSDFKDVVGEESGPPKRDHFAEMDEKYHVVNEGGEVRIYYRHDDVFGKGWRGVDVKNFIESATFIDGHGSKKIKGRGEVPRAKLWLEQQDRLNKRVYKDCVFDPSDSVGEDIFNKWMGLAVEPEEGDWSMFRALVFDILAAGDQKVYDYIMNWCALAVQRPWEKPRTTIIFRGIEGTGKSLFGEMFTKIFGRHGLRLDSPAQVTSRFNEHLAEKIAVFIDEAVWSGDRKHEGIIKSLITDAVTTFEGKFKPTVMGLSYAHSIIATNNEYAARIAGRDARRYVVLNVEKKKSPKWYKDFVENHKKATPARWLDFLLKRDISKFDPATERPLTDAYEYQMLMSEDPVKSWLRGFIENEYHDDVIHPAQGDRLFRREDIRQSILAFYKEIGERVYERGFERVLYEKLNKFLKVRRQRLTVAEDNGRRPWCYEFPPLEVARKEFELDKEPPLDNTDDLI